MKITALLVSPDITAGLTPATSAGAATETEHCIAIIPTSGTDPDTASGPPVVGT